MVLCVIERIDAMDFFPLSSVQSRISLRVFWCIRHIVIKIQIADLTQLGNIQSQQMCTRY